MGTGDMENAFKRSLKDPAGFWGEAAEAVHWHKKWERCWTTADSRFIAGLPGER